MILSKEQIARMIDISAVKAESGVDEVETIVKVAKEHHFICVFTLPSLAPYAKKFLAGDPDIYLGGTVGFPSGASSTTVKALEADELLEIGCDELDMVINIGKLKSNLYQDVQEDIKQIVDLAGSIPVKVILEVSLLSDSEIQAGAKIVRDCGAKFVKTGTGWSGATTLAHINTIKDAVGDSINIKVAGGVRDLDTLLTISEMGVTRFGIGCGSAIKIVQQYHERFG